MAEARGVDRQRRLERVMAGPRSQAGGNTTVRLIYVEFIEVYG